MSAVAPVIDAPWLAETEVGRGQRQTRGSRSGKARKQDATLRLLVVHACDTEYRELATALARLGVHQVARAKTPLEAIWLSIRETWDVVVIGRLAAVSATAMDLHEHFRRSGGHRVAQLAPNFFTGLPEAEMPLDDLRLPGHDEGLTPSAERARSC